MSPPTPPQLFFLSIKCQMPKKNNRIFLFTLDASLLLHSHASCTTHAHDIHTRPQNRIIVTLPMPDMLRRFIISTGLQCVPAALLHSAKWGDGGGGGGSTVAIGVGEGSAATGGFNVNNNNTHGGDVDGGGAPSAPRTPVRGFSREQPASSTATMFPQEDGGQNDEDEDEDEDDEDTEDIGQSGIANNDKNAPPLSPPPPPPPHLLRDDGCAAAADASDAGAGDTNKDAGLSSTIDNSIDINGNSNGSTFPLSPSQRPQTYALISSSPSSSHPQHTPTPPQPQPPHLDDDDEVAAGTGTGTGARATGATGATGATVATSNRWGAAFDELPPLLPQPHHTKRDKLCVVLDIDETLAGAHSLFTPHLHPGTRLSLNSSVFYTRAPALASTRLF